MERHEEVTLEAVVGLLEGLWKDAPLNLTDEDFRQASHELSEALKRRAEKYCNALRGRYHGPRVAFGEAPKARRARAPSIAGSGSGAPYYCDFRSYTDAVVESMKAYNSDISCSGMHRWSFAGPGACLLKL
jgi:hypothetical protein